MSELKINKDSWHYWVAEKVCSYEPSNYGEDNICAYLRAVAVGLLLILIGTILALVLTLLVADALAWLAACLFNWTFIAPFGPTGFLVLVAVFAGSVFGMNAYLNQKAPGSQVAKEAWRSVKDKTCIRIKVE